MLNRISHKRLIKIAWMTAAYVLLLIGIVFLADHPQYSSFFSIIRNVPGGDKGGHFLLMGLASFLLNASLGCRTLKVPGGRLLLGGLIVSVAVTAEEISQLFVASRSFDLMDLLFDYLGIWVFGRVAVFAWKRRPASTGDQLGRP